MPVIPHGLRSHAKNLRYQRQLKWRREIPAVFRRFVLGRMIPFREPVKTHGDRLWRIFVHPPVLFLADLRLVPTHDGHELSRGEFSFGAVVFRRIPDRDYKLNRNPRFFAAPMRRPVVAVTAKTATTVSCLGLFDPRE